MKTNRIYNMDCLDGLKEIPDNSIDVIFTSPPYNKAGYEGFIRKPHKSDSWKIRNIDYDDKSENDFMDDVEYQNWQINVLNECCRVLKEDGSVFYNHKVRIAQHKASHPVTWCLQSRLTFRQQIIWDRGNSPTVAPIRFVPTTELILWFTKSATQPNFRRSKDSAYKTEVLRINPSKNINHPAAFPKELVDAFLVNIDNRHGTAIVLDPFIGSGTTALSAIDNGFQYIGFDKSKKYVEQANNLIMEKFYNEGNWVQYISPHECELCNILYDNTDKDLCDLDEDLVEHLSQIRDYMLNAIQIK